MSRIVGIDLGTTNSLVATVDSGIPLVIADAEGRRLTPSTIFFPAQAEERIVGAKALRLRMLHPRETVFSVKRFMGRRFNELEPEEFQLPYRLTGQGSGPVKIALPSGERTPEEISAEVLRKLKGDAERFFGEPVSRAVITVPAYFNDAQRSATKRAGELAGFTVERIVNEPTAAALAYGLDKLRERSRIAVYDLGGGTFDLSILELTEGVFQVLATHGNTRLGGDDLDRIVTRFLAKKIREAGGPDPEQNPMLLAQLAEAAERAKIALSDQESVRVSLPFYGSQDFSFSYELTRMELETLTREIIERTRAHCLRALADAKLEAKDLDQVILVGGQTRMPLVRSLVSEWFSCVDFEGAAGNVGMAGGHRSGGPTLNTSQNPDEAVALGAAIQAEILQGGFQHMLLLDVTPLSLGIETFGGLMNVIIPRNSTIPVKAGELFTTAVDGQRQVLVHVLQGERERAKDNWSLGKFTLDFEAGPRGSARVGVQFEIDSNGILHVLARDLNSGKEVRADLKSAADVEDAEVQRMVEESVEHAFSDLAARRWVEGKLRAGEMLRATRNALEELRSELPPEEAETISRAAAATQAALDTEEDLARLTEALNALDQATRGLADLLMNRALEQALRNKGVL